MANILKPLQVQSPFQQLAQGASAVGAYEQLMGIREKRQAEAAKMQRQALVQKLAGPAMAGDPQASAMLQLTDPEAYMRLNQLQGQMQQAQGAGREAMAQGQRVEDMYSRQNILRNVDVMRGAIHQLRQNPGDQEMWDMMRAKMVNEGAVEEGTFGDEFPTEEELADAERQLDITANIAQDSVSLKQLQGKLRDAATAYGYGTPQFKNAARQLWDAELGQMQQKRKGEPLGDLPPGYKPLDPGVNITRTQRNNTRKAAEGIMPVIDLLDRMTQHANKHGWTWTNKEANELGLGMATSAGVLMSRAFGLGALDEGLVREVNKMIPKDLGQFRQWATKSRIKSLRDTMVRNLQTKARVNNMSVDVEELLGNQRPMHTILKGLSPGEMTLEQSAALSRYLQTELGMKPQDVFNFIQNRQGNNKPQRPTQTPGGEPMIPTPPGATQQGAQQGVQQPGANLQQQLQGDQASVGADLGPQPDSVTIRQTETIENQGPLPYSKSLRFLWSEFKDIPRGGAKAADWMAQKLEEGHDKEALRDIYLEKFGQGPKNRKRFVRVMGKVWADEARANRIRQKQAERSQRATPQAQAPQQSPGAQVGPSPVGPGAQQAQPVPVQPQTQQAQPVPVQPQTQQAQPVPVQPQMQQAQPAPAPGVEDMQARQQGLDETVQQVGELDYMREIENRLRERGELPPLKQPPRERPQPQAPENAPPPNETRQQRRIRLRKERIEARKSRARRYGQRAARRVFNDKTLFPLLDDDEKRNTIQNTRRYQEYLKKLDEILPDVPRPGSGR